MWREIAADSSSAYGLTRNLKGPLVEEAVFPMIRKIAQRVIQGAPGRRPAKQITPRPPGSAGLLEHRAVAVPAGP